MLGCFGAERVGRETTQNLPMSLCRTPFNRMPPRSHLGCSLRLFKLTCRERFHISKSSHGKSVHKGRSVFANPVPGMRPCMRTLGMSSPLPATCVGWQMNRIRVSDRHTAFSVVYGIGHPLPSITSHQSVCTSDHALPDSVCFQGLKCSPNGQSENHPLDSKLLDNLLGAGWLEWSDSDGKGRRKQG